MQNLENVRGPLGEIARDELEVLLDAAPEDFVSALPGRAARAALGVPGEEGLHASPEDGVLRPYSPLDELVETPGELLEVRFVRQRIDGLAVIDSFSVTIGASRAVRDDVRFPDGIVPGERLRESGHLDARVRELVGDREKIVAAHVRAHGVEEGDSELEALLSGGGLEENVIEDFHGGGRAIAAILKLR